MVTDQSGQMLAMADVKEGAGGPDRPVTGWGGAAEVDIGPDYLR